MFFVGLNERLAAVTAMQKHRGRPLLTYVTSRRENLAAQISHDVLSVIYEHLSRLIPERPSESLDLFLISLGGDTTVPLIFQNLLREFSKRVSVLIPAECYSAGSMIALGADEIVMAPLGQLSPIDPSLNHPLNPQSPIVQPLATGQPGNPLVPIEVEQVFSFLSLAKDKAGLKSEDSILRAFLCLADKVHPIALGEIHRTHSLIRKLAEELLRLHSNDEKVIKAAIEALTEKLFSHSYRISRKQAAEQLKLPVLNADAATEKAMMLLRSQYVTDGKMDEPFNAQVEIQDAIDVATIAAAAVVPPQVAVPVFPLTLRYERVFVGSAAGDSVWTQARRVTQAAPGQIQIPGVAVPNTSVYNVRDTFKWESTWV